MWTQKSGLQSVCVCGFDGVGSDIFLRGEPFTRKELEVRVKKFKNGKAAATNEATGETIKGIV